MVAGLADGVSLQRNNHAFEGSAFWGLCSIFTFLSVAMKMMKLDGHYVVDDSNNINNDIKDRRKYLKCNVELQRQPGCAHALRLFRLDSV